MGVATLLVDAIEKLAEARGAKRLTVDASDTARDFFDKRGFEAQHRNTVPRGRRVARQHDDGEDARPAAPKGRDA